MVILYDEDEVETGHGVRILQLSDRYMVGIGSLSQHSLLVCIVQVEW